MQMPVERRCFTGVRDVSCSGTAWPAYVVALQLAYSLKNSAAWPRTGCCLLQSVAWRAQLQYVLAGRTTHSQNAIVAFSLHYTPRRIIWPILSDLIYRPRGSRRIDVYYVTNYNIMHSCNGKFMHHESEWQWPSNVTTGLIYQMQPMKLFSTSRQQNITIYKLNTH